MNVEKHLQRLCEQIVDCRNRARWLIEHSVKLGDIPEISPSGGSNIDFDNLPHKEVIKVVRAFGGKWKKIPSPSKVGRIDYEATIDGVAIRCWQGEPPPSCKLIEVEEHIPEQVIPAHTVKKLKMSCHPSLEAQITTAQEKAVCCCPSVACPVHGLPAGSASGGW